MGYNQHNAGMHFISFRHNDLYYNDRLYEEELSLMKNKEKKKAIELNKELTEGSKKNVMETIEKNSNRESQSIKKIKEKKGGNSPKKQYGTELIISKRCIESYVSLSETIKSNVMRIIFEKELNVRQVFNDCEKAMTNDLRANPAPEQKEYGLFNYPYIEKSILALTVLADRINCSVYELFINDETRKKNFAYSLLDRIEKVFSKGEEDFGGYYSTFTPEELTDGSVEINIDSFDSLCCLNEECVFYEDDAYRTMSMDLVLNKYTVNKEIWYGMRFGINLINSYTAKCYYLVNAELWYEQSGRLKEFVEDVLSHCSFLH